VEAYNKLIKKTSICELNWLIRKIILRCTVSETSKFVLLKFRKLLKVPISMEQGVPGQFKKPALVGQQNP